jgi:outer membrane biosynthesis protein TonB
LVSILAQPVETTLYVAIDENGKLVDTWVLAGSGYPTIDAEALNAARLSRYDPATSYCRQVGGVYVVDEIFTPP